MGWLYEDDYPDYIDEIFDDACLNLDDCNDVNLFHDVWTLARESEESPHIGNYVMCEMFARIQYGLADRYGDDAINYEINSVASHMYVGNEEVHTYEEMIERLDERESSL